MAVDDLYIPDGVFLKCDEGAKITTLKVNHKKHKLYGEIIATEIDNIPIINIPSFGACSATGSACLPKSPEWKRVHEGATKIEGKKPLLQNSFCKCQQGGTIDIFFNEDEAIDLLETDKKYRVDKDPMDYIMAYSNPVLIRYSASRDLTGGDSSNTMRGIRKGVKSSWVFLTEDMWDSETWKGLGKIIVAETVGYTPPLYNSSLGGIGFRPPSQSEIDIMEDWINFTPEERIAYFDKIMGTDLISIHEGLKEAMSDFYDKKILNATKAEVEVMSGQTVETVAESVIISKGLSTLFKFIKSIKIFNKLSKSGRAYVVIQGFVKAKNYLKLDKAIIGIFKVGEKSPYSYGIRLLKDNRKLMDIFDEALNRLANSKRNNAYKRYIKAKNNNFSGLSETEIQNLCEDVWNTARNKIVEVASERGVVLNGEIHHWNYPKFKYPHDILNPNQLTEPIDRSLHTLIHQQTTLYPSEPWKGPINPDYSISPPPYDLPQPID